MKLLELHLAGFGRLVDRTFTFAPGLNLVHGPNEAGKSTLQRAIMALLYGFFDDGRISQEDRAVLAANKPWDTGASFAGSLVYALDDGRRFQVKRTLYPRPQTSLMSLPDNTDVSYQFRSASDGRLFFADTHLGMSRSVFDNVCSVRQAELAALESSAVSTITTTIMRLSAAGSSDTTTDEALAALEKAIRDDVGSTRAWTKPLAQTTQRLADLDKQRSRTQIDRNDLLSQIEALRQTEEEIVRLRVESDRLLYLQSLAERESLLQEQRAIQDAAAVVDLRAAEVARWAQWADFPVHLRDEITSLEGQRQHLLDDLRRAERRAGQAAEALQPIQAEITAVVARIANLEDARNTPTEHLTAVQELAAQWKQAAESHQLASERSRDAKLALVEASEQLAQLHDAHQPLIALGRAGLARVRQQMTGGQQRIMQAEANLRQAQSRWDAVGMSEARFNELGREVHEILSGTRVAPPPRRGCNLFKRTKKAPEQPPLEIVLYEQAKLIHDELLRMQSALDAAKHDYAEEEEAGRRLLGQTGAAPLDDAAFEHLGACLDEHLQEQTIVNQLTIAAAEASGQAEAAAHALDAASDILQERLAELGFIESSVSQALAAFMQRCDRKQSLVSEEAALEKLRMRAQNLERDAEEHQRLTASLHETEMLLQGLMRRAKIVCDPTGLNDAVFKFRTHLADHERWRAAVSAHDEAKRHLRGLIETQRRTGTDSRLATVEASMGEVVSRFPEWAALKAERTIQAYRDLHQRTSQESVNLQDRQRRLRDAIDSTSSSLRHPAEIDEAIAAERSQLRHLEWYRDALQLAHDELSEARQEYQRQFAPRLKQLMEEGLAGISHNRYTSVTVDPSTLIVSLKAPERPEPVDVTNLSTGTRDLVYLMLRIAIARLLSHSAETLPLMMDDPLVQFDRGRQERALEFLSQLAADTQVFLFTKDEWAREWFQNLSASADTRALHRLG